MTARSYNQCIKKSKTSSLHFYFLFSLCFFSLSRSGSFSHLCVLLSYHIVIHIMTGFSLGFVRYLLDLLYILLGLMVDGVGFILWLAGSIWIVWGLEGLLLTAIGKTPH